MPRYVIHVGPHKTGSTYLQVLFQQLAPQLRERGVLYPVEWLGEAAPGHIRLAERLRSGRTAGLADEFERLNQSGYETILISSEDLSDLSSDEMALLKSFLRGNAHVVFYCRRWLELLPSSWQELVKHGQSTTFPEMMAINLMNPYVSSTINYAIKLDRFEQVFGIENLFIASYSNIIDRGGDLGEHFFRSYLFWPNAPLVTGIRPNASLSTPDAEMIRALNAFEWTHLARRSPAVRVKYLKMRSQLCLSGVFAAMQRHFRSFRLNENARNLRILHDEMFGRYGHRLAPPLSGRYFFIQKSGGIEYVDQDYLAEEGVFEALSAAYEKIRE